MRQFLELKLEKFSLNFQVEVSISKCRRLVAVVTVEHKKNQDEKVYLKIIGTEKDTCI